MVKRRALLAWVFALLFLAVAVRLTITFFPLEIGEIQQRWTLWRNQIHEFYSGGLQGFSRDQCKDSSPNACTCVALVHGLGDQALTWKNILYYNDWKQPLRFYAFNLPGTGNSERPQDPKGYAARTQAKALRMAMQPLCPKWVVIGNSLGGWISAWLAIDWPEGVERLLLADSAGLKAQESESHANFLNGTIEGLKEFQKRAYFRPRPIPENVWREIGRRAGSSNVGQVRSAQTEDQLLDSKLGAVKQPTVILWGQADQITPLSGAKAFQSKIRGSVLREAKECGHLPQKECPRELISALETLLRFGAM